MIDLNNSFGIKTNEEIWATRLVLRGALMISEKDAEKITDLLCKGLHNFMLHRTTTPSWMRNPNTGRWSRYKVEDFERFLTTIKNKKDTESYELAASYSEKWQDAPEMSCTIVRFPEALRIQGCLSYLRFTLPSNLIEKDLDNIIVQQVVELASTIEAESGWIGLGLEQSPEETIASNYLTEEYLTAQRFEGIDVGRVAITSVNAHRGIRGVNWLTVIGNKWLRNLHNGENLAVALPKQASLLHYSNGIVIRACSHPEIGDTNQMQKADSYRSVGRLLQSIRMDKHGRFHKLRGMNVFGFEQTDNWLARFDT